MSAEVIAEIERQTRLLADGLSVRGLMNIQFAVKDGSVYLIEVNPRASRTVPFVAKAIGAPVAKIAARVMAGEKLRDLPAIDRDIDDLAGQGGGLPVQPFPLDRPGAVAGDEVHGRSHGDRSRFHHRLRQGAARRDDGAFPAKARCSSA
ncbi:hypothetical protein AB5I41_04390 [Sphingomonas sp. MMS24-JH45]